MELGQLREAYDETAALRSSVPVDDAAREASDARDVLPHIWEIPLPEHGPGMRSWHVTNHVLWNN